MISGDTFSKKDPVAITLNIASAQEYDYTIAAIQAQFSLSDAQIKFALGAWIDTTLCRIKIIHKTQSTKKDALP
jgi:hypothetical protein